MPIRGSIVERSRAGLIRNLYVGTFVQKLRHNLAMPLPRRKVKWDLAILICSLHVCPAAKQQRHDFVMSLVGSKMEGSQTILTCSIYICPFFTQELRPDLAMPLICRNVE
jgi:hypothetical protein